MGNTTGATSPEDWQFRDCACRIVVIGPNTGEDCVSELARLPRNARILAMGSTLEELQRDGQLFTEANVLLNLRGNAESLQSIMQHLPYLEWVHSVTAGIDHILCPELLRDEIVLTNAKGIFSSSLAEYVMGVCCYFAKDFPRLVRQRQERNWQQYCVTELRGKTMGIVGYGDIGLACAKLAKAYGMQVIGLRKNPKQSQHDPNIDYCVGTDKLWNLLEESDFLVVACALTDDTRGLFTKEQFARCKPGQIFINISRGAVVNEDHLYDALSSGGRLGGAALDVFCEEPLPTSSKLWDLDNVLLSPHNADMTNDFRHKSVQFFTENCARFIASLPLNNVVSAKQGY
jgi:phosphoglycerate dehydrogenase-like enzyme